MSNFVGFTGTQRGMTEAQANALDTYLRTHPVEYLHHGDCEGADQQAHAIARARGIRVVIHPPEDPKKRAYCDDAAVLKEPLPYLERNHRIVDDCNILVACPGEMSEVLRSGTWATIRYARKQRRPVVIIYPDGAVSETPTSTR